MTKTPANRRMSEQVLIERVAKGDKEAFQEILDRHQTAIYRYCRLMVKDEVVAEDMFQDTFFAFYRICREGKSIHNVRGYLVVTARSRCLDYLQLRQRHVSIEEAPEPIYEHDITIGELQEHLRSALQLIPDQYREAFILFTLKEYSYDEIAKVLKISRHVVKNRIYRAKQSLQKILSPLLRDSHEEGEI